MGVKLNIKKEIFEKILSDLNRNFEIKGKLSHKRGTEARFQSKVVRHLPKNLKQGIQSNVRGEGLKILNLVGGRSRVLLDFVINCDHVFELKVVRMPQKISTSSKGSLYDVGQIITDIDRAYQANVKSINALVLLYGPLVEDLASSNSIIREFHDRCYLDISKSVL